MWVLERNVRLANGKPIPTRLIGLGTKNQQVRSSLPSELQQALNSWSEWFKYLEDYRHSLAHRIPLYIPPFGVAPQDVNEWANLDSRIVSLRHSGESSELQALKARERELRFFRPIIAHSFIENSRPVPIHLQMLSDFKTVHELAEKLIAAINT
jgi:hypothetical protein